VNTQNKQDDEAPRHHVERIEEGLRSLFIRTGASGPPLDADALLIRAVQQAMRRRRPLWRVGLGVAAALLLVASIGAGWWAGGRASARQASRFEAAVAANHRQLRRELAQMLQVAQAEQAQRRTAEAKRLALLLRDDYVARIGTLRAALVDQVASGPRNAWPPRLEPAVIYMEK